MTLLFLFPVLNRQTIIFEMVDWNARNQWYPSQRLLNGMRAAKSLPEVFQRVSSKWPTLDTPSNNHQVSSIHFTESRFLHNCPFLLFSLLHKKQESQQKWEVSYLKFKHFHDEMLPFFMWNHPTKTLRSISSRGSERRPSNFPPSKHLRETPKQMTFGFVLCVLKSFGVEVSKTHKCFPPKRVILLKGSSCFIPC